MWSPPSWAAHLEDKLAPMPLLLVQAFVDTLDTDRGTDILADDDEARAWLADAGLLGSGDQSGEDLRLARESRGSLRALIRHNTTRQPVSDRSASRQPVSDRSASRQPVSDRSASRQPVSDGELEPLAEVLSRAQPRMEVTADGRVSLFAPSPPASTADGLLRLLLIIRDAQADGSWDRLKLCGNPDCLWAFYDRSHSRRGAWCDMASCGNRLNNRNFRARRARPGGHPEKA
jgi:predicted RNA-binding Zn ribbon-like protein